MDMTEEQRRGLRVTLSARSAFASVSEDNNV